MRFARQIGRAVDSLTARERRERSIVAEKRALLGGFAQRDGAARQGVAT